MSESHWIGSAIKHHGVFRKAAKAAGKSTEEFARMHEHSPGVMGKRARLAMTLMHLNHHDNMTSNGATDEEADAAIEAAGRHRK